MVKITIIGWYGTETVGDRAILLGILLGLKKSFVDFEVQLGSIYPFFTERTLIEDISFYQQALGDDNLDISIFDTQNITALNQSLRWADIVVMGGGPLMGMWSLYMIEYAFKKAKKLKKQTIILGCGFGPIVERKYAKTLVNIVNKSDLTIFRDTQSCELYQSIAGAKSQPVMAAIDPAVIAAVRYKELYPIHNDILKQEEAVVASIRDFPMEYRINDSITGDKMNDKVLNILFSIQEKANLPIELLPMHYFSIGGDDRVYMNKLRFEYENSKPISVQNNPLSLKQTFDKFSNAALCVGMRFHSVVLQTFLNGNNFVIDYTDPKTGKISGFLNQLGIMEQYKEKYVNIQSGKLEQIESWTASKIDDEQIEKILNIYNKLQL